MSYVLMPILLGLLFGFGLYSVVMTISRWKSGIDFAISDFFIGVIFVVIGFYPLYRMLTWN